MPHAVLSAVCQKHHLSLRRARLLIMVYGGPRMIKIREVFSSIFTIGCSIIAGCSFATTMLRVV
eukprot:3400930-Pyramimonas_sp.AAC.1